MNLEFKKYIIRYLPGEICGTLLSVCSSWSAAVFTGSTALAAAAGTWGATIGFYAAIGFSDVCRSVRAHKKEEKVYGFGSVAKNVRDLSLEFGLSEVFDTLFIRPASLFISITMAHNIVVGALLGKIVADGVFYGLAIFSQRRFVNKSGRE